MAVARLAHRARQAVVDLLHDNELVGQPGRTPAAKINGKAVADPPAGIDVLDQTIHVHIAPPSCRGGEGLPVGIAQHAPLLLRGGAGLRDSRGLLFIATVDLSTGPAETRRGSTIARSCCIVRPCSNGVLRRASASSTISEVKANARRPCRSAAPLDRGVGK